MKRNQDKPINTFMVGVEGRGGERNYGLTKLEYAAIQIMAANVKLSQDEATLTLDAYAEQSVVAAKLLFEELEKQTL